MMHGQKNIKSQIFSCDSVVGNERYEDQHRRRDTSFAI